MKVSTKNVKWLKSEPWKDQDAYIIGGGSSLRGFDWGKLNPLNTVGCNDAYKLGRKVCKVCVFGDYSWWRHHSEKLEGYHGIVVTNTEALAVDKPPWVHYYDRQVCGMSNDGALGWNGNTGSVAVNLALVLGAKTVYLLGFDMGLGRKNKSNWHDEIIHPDAVLPSSYQLFLDRWTGVSEGARDTFPDRKVYNLNDKSNLPGMKSMSFTEYWEHSDG